MKNIVIIGLKARKDRWKRCVEIFEKEGIEEVTHYTTLQSFKDTHKHYMKDFLQMLRIKGKHDLMFFEDDFELVDGWREVLDKAMKDLPEDWDMLYLGANLTRPAIRVTDNLVRVKGAWLMHATLLRKEFIDYILKEYKPEQVPIIDEWYRLIAPERKFYMTYPMVSYQRSDYSDFLGQYVYYDIFENKHYKTL